MTLQERLTRLNQKLQENDPGRRSAISTFPALPAPAPAPETHCAALQPEDLQASNVQFALKMSEMEDTDALMQQATSALSAREMANVQLRRELLQVEGAHGQVTKEETATTQRTTHYQNFPLRISWQGDFCSNLHPADLRQPGANRSRCIVAATMSHL